MTITEKILLCETTLSFPLEIYWKRHCNKCKIILDSRVVISILNFFSEFQTLNLIQRTKFEISKKCLWITKNNLWMSKKKKRILRFIWISQTQVSNSKNIVKNSKNNIWNTKNITDYFWFFKLYALNFKLYSMTAKDYSLNMKRDFYLDV